MHGGLLSNHWLTVLAVCIPHRSPDRSQAHRPCSRESVAGTLEWKTLNLLNSESCDYITIQRWHTWIKGKHTPVWKCLSGFNMLLTKIKMKWYQKTDIHKHEMKLPTGNHENTDARAGPQCPQCEGVDVCLYPHSTPQDRCGSTHLQSLNPISRERSSSEWTHQQTWGTQQQTRVSQMRWKVRSVACDCLKATYVLCHACVCTFTDRFSLRSTVYLKT